MEPAGIEPASGVSAVDAFQPRMDLMGIEPTVPRAFRFNDVTPP